MRLGRIKLCLYCSGAHCCRQNPGGSLSSCIPKKAFHDRLHFKEDPLTSIALTKDVLTPIASRRILTPQPNPAHVRNLNKAFLTIVVSRRAFSRRLYH